MDLHQRMVRARIQMQERYPFYAYLAMNMVYIESEAVPTMGVTPTGIIYYNKAWCEGLTDACLMGVLCHEVLHVVQDVATRFKPTYMDSQLFNCAADIIDNNILSYEAGLELPQGGWLPRNDSISISLQGGNMLTIDDISKKTIEEVYHILEKNRKKMPKEKGFDIIIMDADPNGQAMKDLEKQNPELAQKIRNGKVKPITGEKLKKLMATASVMARQRGTVSAGLERLLEMGLNPKVNWRDKLRNYLKEKLMSDYTWRRPSRRSESVGCYLPSPRKDTELECVVHRDTSGSISDEESMQVATEVN
jgi:predicted metal-dependent peptidase